MIFLFIDCINVKRFILTADRFLAKPPFSVPSSKVTFYCILLLLLVFILWYVTIPVNCRTVPNRVHHDSCKTIVISTTYEFWVFPPLEELDVLFCETYLRKDILRVRRRNYFVTRAWDNAHRYSINDWQIYYLRLVFTIYKVRDRNTLLERTDYT